MLDWNWPPLSRDQDLRVDKGVYRFMQAVDLDLAFHRDDLFDDPRDGVARDAVTMIDHCRTLLQCLQDQVEWSAEGRDESEIAFLKFRDVRDPGVRELQIFFPNIRCRHRLEEYFVWHVRAGVVGASDCLRDIVAG